MNDQTYFKLIDENYDIEIEDEIFYMKLGQYDDIGTIFQLLDFKHTRIPLNNGLGMVNSLTTPETPTPGADQE